MIKELLLISGLIYSNCDVILNNSFNDVQIAKLPNKNINDYDVTQKIYLLDIAGNGVNSNKNYLYKFYVQTLNYGYLYSQNILFINFQFGYDLLNLSDRTVTSYNLIYLDTWDYIDTYSNYEYILNNIERIEIQVSLTNIVLGPSNADVVINPSSYISIIANADNWIRIDNSQYTQRNITFVENLTNISFNGSAYSTNYYYHRSLYYNDAYQYGFNNGNILGYNQGYSEGLIEGFENGIAEGQLNFNVVDWITTALDGFLSFEIYPNFSLASLLMAVTGTFIALWILKVLAGG